MTRRAVLAITGASGAIYGVRLLDAMEQQLDLVYLCVSRNGRDVASAELGVRLEDGDNPATVLLGRESQHVKTLAPDDFFTPPASGSARHDGMVIAPCSMGTAGRIAAGVSDDLITRAADVCLKERRPLILLVRETPLNLIHLRSLTTLAEAGAVVMPACPAFYHLPKTIEEAVDTVVARALQHLGLTDRAHREWQTGKP